MKSLKIRLYRLITFFPAVIAASFVIVARPWIQIRFIRLFSYRIGHYALNTELLLHACKSNIFGNQKKWKTFFYIAPSEPVCNTYLHKMWKRVIPILPCAWIWYQADRLLMIILGEKYQNEILKKTFEPSSGARDCWGFLASNKKCHLEFTEAEKRRGIMGLNKLGLDISKPWVCLLGRDSVYLRTHLPETDWSYHDFRNMDINQYKQAALWLAEQGYSVIRMGKNVSEKFEVDHPDVIDYANHPCRSDFMDIYLGAHCTFFVSPRSGIDAVAQIFRRPLLVINFPLCDFRALYALNIFITKRVFDRNKKKFISFSEMCWEYDRHCLDQILRRKNWIFIDNSDEEILDAVKEMVQCIKGKKTPCKNDLIQKNFWRCIPEFCEMDFNKINMQVGHNFLLDNAELL